MLDIQDWLDIQIKKNDLSNNRFEIIVQFKNQSSEEVSWKYENALNKAELLSFTILNKNGKAIESLDFIIGTPKPCNEKAPKFQPGATQSYTISCQLLASGHLKVGDFHYPITFNQKHSILFQYGGINSNKISWIPNEI